MRLTRFSNVVQPVFPNQRSDEKIFVFSRRHFIDFLPTIIIISILLILPAIFIALIWNQSLDFGDIDLVYSRDFIVLISLVYWLIIEIILITSWINFYYNVFVVSNERVVEIAQKGLFSHEVNELAFAQIEDVSFKTKGFLNSVFEVGDIEIQTAGTERNFYIKRLPHAQLIVEIIHNLDQQAVQRIPVSRRNPDLATVGVINGQPISSEGKKPAIMNFNQNLQEASKMFGNSQPKPRNLREKIDRWWWTDRNRMLATFGRDEAEEDKSEQEERDSGEKVNSKTDGDMLDL